MVKKHFQKLLLAFVFCLIVITIVAASTITAFAAEIVTASNTEYTITYHLDGGINALKNPDVYTSEDVITLKDAYKEGYDFAGWYLDVKKTNKITKISNRSGNIDLYAKFVPKSYTAFFDDNGADTSSDLKITLLNQKTNESKRVYLNNGDIFSPYDFWMPSANGYVFAGWMYDSKVIENDFFIDKDITLEAKWIDNPNNYPILGDDLKEIKISGPSTLPSGSRSFDQSTKFYVAYNYEEVYVSGKTATYRDYYNSGHTYASYDGTLFSTGEPYSGEIRRMDNFARFANVSVGTLHTISLWGSMPPSYTFLFGDSYIQVQPTVKKDLPQIGVSNSREISQEYDATFKSPNVEKTGYFLEGWYNEQGEKAANTWIYTENQSFTANWEPIKYYITYELNGGRNHAANPAVYTIEDSITLSAPSKPGYTFLGWYLDKDFQTPISSISKRTGSITLYAKYSINTYNLSLNADGGSFSPRVNFMSDGKIIRSQYLGEIDSIDTYRPAKKDGYIFGGWYKDVELTSLFKFTGTIADDITLYAKWIECDNEIVNPESSENIAVNINGKTEQLYAFVPLNDGNIIVSSSSNGLDLFGILYNSSKTILTSHDDIDDECLDFVYSYDVKAGQLYYISVKGNTATTSGDADIGIIWIGDCTITGTTYTDRTIKVVYDELFTLPDMATRDGYVFLGWFDETDTQITNGKWEFSSNKTLTAKWREKTPQVVTFKDANGTIIATQNYLYGDTIIPPEFPAKAADQVYFYVASWDNDYSGICTGDVIYTVKYTPVYIDYSIIFKDENGAVLSTNTYHYGDSVIVPETPTKAADNTYTYKFKDWDTAVTSVNGDKIYTATYTAKYIDYTVIFKNYDGSIITESTYHYGDIVVAPATPIRVADNTYTYSFAGWDKEVVACTGDTIYTAVFTPVFIEYEIVFKNFDDFVLSRKYYHYGDTITVPSTPSKPSDSTYAYSFAGWDTAVVNCDGNKTYIATFTPTYIEYTIVFKNADGKEISSKKYHYGDVVIVPETPTKDSDNTYTYSFKAWDTAVTLVNGDKTYTATYTATYVDYTIVFKNYDGEVLGTNTYHYGDVVTIPLPPTKPADETYTYAFAGWDSDVENCDGNKIYTATYNSIYIDYTVTFKNEDGSVISEEKYHYGDTVEIPETPTKQSNNTYTYTFAGWGSEVVACYGNKVYTASFMPVFIEYTVVFKDWNGNVISSNEYHYGQTVTKPSNPTREADNTYTYAFAGWDKTITSCTESTVYTATYSSTYIDYEIVFKNYDGSILSSETYHYGDAVVVPETPTKPADESYTYGFAGWDSEVTACLGNKIYTATFNPINVEYTVVFKDWNGNIISSETYYFGAEVVVPENPTRNADNIYTYTFKNWGKTVAENCVGDAEYTAVYTATYIEYNIKFLDWDGSLIQTVKYHYGDTITAIADPERVSDETYTYTFLSWNKALGTCTSNASFTAQYESTFINYTVVFKDYDGSVISRKTYHFGDSIVIPTNPVRASDDTYSYTFKNWGNISTSCNGNKEYTANYDAIYIDYTVVFKNHDGSVISTQTYHFGDDVTAPQNPTKTADNTYTYTFAGWDKEIVDCVANATYTASYTPTFIDYTVVFKDSDGSVLSTKTYHYGDAVSAPEAPTKVADGNYTYTFKAWDKEMVACVGDAVYTAVYTSTKIEGNDSTETPTTDNTIDKSDSGEDKSDENKVTETDANSNSGCGGCGSSTALSALAIVAVIGSAIVIKKKED